MDNLSAYLIDLTQNAIAAKASLIELTLTETNKLDIELHDNGCGMDETTLIKATSPYFTTRKTRKVGLGLSMIKLLSEQTEGTFDLQSKPHEGTKLHVSFDLHHIDMPPRGDLGEMVVLISIHQDVTEFIFTYQKHKEHYTYRLSDMKKMLGETLQDINIINFIKDYINQEIMKVRGIT